MTGCRHNAKNTLVKNYLYLAEQQRRRGAAADHGHPDRAAATAAGTTSRVRYTKAKHRPRRRRCSPPSRWCSRPPSLGTQRLLHRMKDEGHLPRLSAAARPPLAHQLRVDPRRHRARRRPDRLHLGRRDHLELPPRRGHPHRAGPLRQGQQHDGACCRRCSPTATATSRAGGPGCGRCGRSAPTSRDLYDFKHWSERTVIALVMQSLDNSITTYSKRGRFTAAGG